MSEIIHLSFSDLIYCIRQTICTLLACIANCYWEAICFEFLTQSSVFSMKDRKIALLRVSCKMACKTAHTQALRLIFSSMGSKPWIKHSQKMMINVSGCNSTAISLVMEVYENSSSLKDICACHLTSYPLGASFAYCWWVIFSLLPVGLLHAASCLCCWCVRCSSR